MELTVIDLLEELATWVETGDMVTFANHHCPNLKVPADLMEAYQAGIYDEDIYQLVQELDVLLGNQL